MPPSSEIETIRRSQIIEAALKTIAARGSANVTMDDICRASGFSKGGLAYYYKSKRELFLAAFTEFFDSIFTRGKETMDRFDDPLEKLLSFTWLYNPDDPDALIGYPVLFDFMAVVVHDDEYRKIFHDWFNKWVILLKGAVDQGVNDGSFSKNIDCESVAQGVSAIYQGIATRWFLASTVHSRQWAEDTLVRSVKGLLASYEGGDF